MGRALAFLLCISVVILYTQTRYIDPCKIVVDDHIRLLALDRPRIAADIEFFRDVGDALMQQYSRIECVIFDLKMHNVLEVKEIDPDWVKQGQLLWLANRRPAAHQGPSG